MAKDRTEQASWQRRPPENANEIRYRIVRTPGSGKLTAVVLSHDLIGCYAHYWGGRTLPCPPEDCEACAVANPRRWHGYIAVWNPASGSVAILELTANAIAPLDQFFRDHRTLKGAELIAHRAPAKPNGRVIITINPGRNDRDHLPNCPDVKSAMATIWGVSPSQPLQGLDQLEKRAEPNHQQVGEKNGHRADSVIPFSRLEHPG